MVLAGFGRGIGSGQRLDRSLQPQFAEPSYGVEDMNETRRFEINEFAQLMNDRVERLEGRLKGMHIVMNAFANELRNQDRDAAERIAGTISKFAESETPSEYVEEIARNFVFVLTHEDDGRPLQ